MVDSLGSSPLHAAAEQGHWDIARLLLEKSMSPWARDANDALPIHNAAKGGHLETARLLLECDRATGSSFNKRGETPLHFAAESGNTELVQLLLSFNPRQNPPPLAKRPPRSLQTSHAIRRRP